MSDTARSDSPSDETDLAYLKRLAVAGRGEPAPFLLLMAVFGGVYGFAALAVVAALLIDGWPTAGVVPGPATRFLGGWIFVAAHLAFLATLLWTGWRTIWPNRVRLNRAASATWTAAFIGLIVVFAMISVFTRNEPPTDAVYSAHLLGPMLLVLWGSAWWVTAITSERRWLLGVAIGSFAAALALAWVGNDVAMLPIMGLSLVLLAFAPAVTLMRERRG